MLLNKKNSDKVQSLTLISGDHIVATIISENQTHYIIKNVMIYMFGIGDIESSDDFIPYNFLSPLETEITINKAGILTKSPIYDKLVSSYLVAVAEFSDILDSLFSETGDLSIFDDSADAGDKLDRLKKSTKNINIFKSSGL